MSFAMRAVEFRNGDLRIGDAERESAVSALTEHYAAGRLTQAEFDQRTSLAYAARTNADLWPLFRDLPQVSPPASSGSRHSRSWQSSMLAPLLLVVVGLLVLTHLPLPILLIVGWLWWGRLFRHWSCGGQSRGSRRAVRGSWS
jgi:hypothetical protein